MLIALLLAAPAWSSESTPQHLWLDHEEPFWDFADLDSGWGPSGADLQVRFRIEADGGARVHMEGDSELSWEAETPGELSMGWVPESGSGWLELDLLLETALDVRFDKWGITFEEEIRDTELSFYDIVFFDPWAMDGSTIRASGDGSSVGLFSFDENVLPLVSLQVSSSLWPEARVDYATQSLRTEAGTMDAAGERISTPVPEEAAGLSQSLIATGDWDAVLDLELYTALAVCVEFLGCEELAGITTPIEDYAEGRMIDFSPTELHHPLPQLSVETTALDLGEVELGSDSSAALGINNLGELGLVGTATVTGDGLAVWPGSISASPGGSDGVFIGFVAEEVGEHSGILTLQTNDPSNPVFEVMLSASVYTDAGEDTAEHPDTGGSDTGSSDTGGSDTGAPDTDAGDTGLSEGGESGDTGTFTDGAQGSSASGDKGGCSCSTTTPPPWHLSLLALGWAGLLRRRP
jgi:MYXO-CTERM domain-containing protein